MPASVADFVKAAEQSGIVTADSLAEFLQGVTPETDATALANRLVKAGRITAFQAKHIYGGKADSLILGPYVVMDLLGKGGMGSVYKAEHRRMRRVIALKVIARAALKSPAAILRFEREVQAAARLEHPNIVTAFDAGEAAGTHYFVMQFVDGRNLADLVKELGPQPVDRAVDWVLQAARGLAYAHGKGVVHRDIKPGNLLVDQDGTVKILDMGLARLDTLDVNQDPLTGTGQVMGTVDYMAPEQAMDTRQADARSDIYSLGATLWYLLTGRPLFSGDTAMNKLMAHVHTPAPLLRSACGHPPPELETAFQRMVAKKPSDRFQSMQEVIAALLSLPQGTAVADSLDVDADDNTARLSAVDIDTDPRLRRASSRPQRAIGGLKPLHLAIGGGVGGTLLLVGLIMFVVRGRGERKTFDRGSTSAHESAAQPTSRLPAVASTMRADRVGAEPTEPHAIAPSRTAWSSTTPPPAIAPFDGVQARRHQEAWAKHLAIEVETTNSIGQKLVVIPPGTFTMGEGRETVEATLTQPFLLGQTEVTQGQWREVMRTEPWRGWRGSIDGDDVAASPVSWDEAVAFCTTLTERERSTGAIRREQEYRLPTETEWEYACRAGTETAFSFGDDASMIEDYAWYGAGWGIAGGNTASEMYVHAVGGKQPNSWNLHDMHGNLWEWVSEWRTDYTAHSVNGPPPRSHDRALRGGAWYDPPANLRSAVRLWSTHDAQSNVLGFRVALTVAPTQP